MTESTGTMADKAGMPSGSLIQGGDVLETTTRMTVIDFNKETLTEQQIQSIDDLLEYKDRDTVTWVIVEGVTNVDIVERIGTILGIHQLVLEDILNTDQRAKFEEYDDYLYIVLKSLQPEDDKCTASYEQISLLVLKNMLFTFKTTTDDLFDSVQQRLKTNKGRIRSQGTDYLTYVVLDTIVDQYSAFMDSLDEAATSIAETLLASEPTQETIDAFYRLKNVIIRMRKNISPTRQLMSGLLRSESDLLHENMHIYFRDISDHVTRVIESIESYRETLSGLLNIYMTRLSFKANEVMKVLTIFASIFIPLTFLAGIYGMNFEYMPELKWKWAYPALLFAFITIPVVLLVYFKKKKWL